MSTSGSPAEAPGVTPMHPSSMEVRDRSRQMERSDQRSPRSPRSSKSPRGGSGARGSDNPMTADQKLDQLLRESMSENAQRGKGQGIGSTVLESPPTNPVSPSMAAAMLSPPRELTRAMPVSPQNIPINDITSDENGEMLLWEVGIRMIRCSC